MAFVLTMTMWIKPIAHFNALDEREKQLKACQFESLIRRSKNNHLGLKAPTVRSLVCACALAMPADDDDNDDGGDPLRAPCQSC